MHIHINYTLEMVIAFKRMECILIMTFKSASNWTSAIVLDDPKAHRPQSKILPANTKKNFEEDKELALHMSSNLAMRSIGSA